jgi:hypothetical protein
MVPLVAVIVTRVVDLPPVVVMVKEMEVAFAGTVTEAGVLATVLLELDSVTTVPPLGAPPFRVTVPVTLEPPTVVDGDRPSDWTCGVVMVRVEDALAM